jgi:hypothetical protein
MRGLVWPLCAAGLVGLVGLVGVGCGGTYSVDPAAAGDGGASEPAAPAGCDLQADPKDSPACVSDDLGYFVDSARGRDDGPGTRLLRSRR